MFSFARFLDWKEGQSSSSKSDWVCWTREAVKKEEKFTTSMFQEYHEVLIKDIVEQCGRESSTGLFFTNWVISWFLLFLFSSSSIILMYLVHNFNGFLVVMLICFLGGMGASLMKAWICFRFIFYNVIFTLYMSVRINSLVTTLLIIKYTP